MKLSDLIHQLQQHSEKHGDMEFSIDVLDENKSQDPEDTMSGDEIVGLACQTDERGNYGWLSVRTPKWNHGK